VKELCSDTMCVFGSGDREVPRVHCNEGIAFEPHDGISHDLPNNRAKEELRHVPADSKCEPEEKWACEKEVQQGHEDSNGETHVVEHHKSAK